MRPGNEYLVGLLLITTGIVLILKHYFHLNIPVVRTILALGLIYLGIIILWGGWTVEKANMIAFNKGTLVIDEKNQEYNLIFSNGQIELPQGVTAQVSERKKVNVIFSNGELRISPGMPVLISVDSAFARTQFPDGAIVNFGSSTYRSKGYVEGEDYLFIKSSVVFGNLQVIQE